MGGRAVISDEEDEIEEEEDSRVGDKDSVDVRGRDDDDEEEDEEEEGHDEYEKDGFIVDDIDEEEEEEGEEEEGEEEDRENSDEERQRKKKRKKTESDKNFVHDEDDYELLQDNNITAFHRPKPGSKKFKRLKKAGRDSEAVESSGFSDEEESDRNSQGSRTAEEKLKRSLFGDDEGNGLPPCLLFGDDEN